MQCCGGAECHNRDNADKWSAPVIIPCPCRLAGCTGCRTAGLRRSTTGCTGCATPRCFHPPKYCSSASTPARTASNPIVPNRRKYAPEPEQATCRPPLRLHRRLRRRKGKRWSCNWRPLLRPDRRSHRLRRPLPTLHRCCWPLAPGDRAAPLYTQDWDLTQIKSAHSKHRNHVQGVTKSQQYGYGLFPLQWLNGNDASRSWKSETT